MKRLPLWKRPYLARRILDIGAGHNPFKGATHVLDFDLTEGHDRGGRRLTVPDSARLILGQAMALPFETASFDYIYASHVLEHVDVPESACREIMRVGAAGYIETPSPFLEQGLAVAAKQPPEYWVHKWFVWSGVPNQLVFEPKTGGGTHRFCSCADGRFMQEFYASVDFAEAQHCFRRSAKTTMLYWESGFQVQVWEQTVDCTTDDRACRFTGMRKALVASCNDLFRARRLLRLKRAFPSCAKVFRQHGHRTLFIP